MASPEDTLAAIEARLVEIHDRRVVHGFVSIKEIQNLLSMIWSPDAVHNSGDQPEN